MAALAGCSDSPDDAPAAAQQPTRAYAMGFSWFPPQPDEAQARAVAQRALAHSDAALILTSPPWTALLSGTSAEDAVRGTVLPQADFYRSNGRPIVVTIDPTNGLDRSRDAPQLEAANRSLTEPPVQQAYRAYVLALDRLLRPEVLGIASETNLVRAIGKPGLYPALVQVARDAAADLRAAGSGHNLFVSVQVEVAWGAGAGPFAGIATDRADFAFINGLGLSSFPYLGGFSDPDALPLDYYRRLIESAPLPVLVIEGGWPSEAGSGPFPSTPQLQQRYIRRQAQLLDRVPAVAWFQISFTDLDIAAWGEGVRPFARLGLVDTALAPKPALADWDELLSRRRACGAAAQPPC
jgi:hypothetical protein